MNDITLVHERNDAKEFVRFALEIGAIQFKETTIVSRRVSPYYIDTGEFGSGSGLSRLALAYARCIYDSEIGFNTLFGPAYKGISLATITAVKLYEEYGWDVESCYNRKEKKRHGEGGRVIGKLAAGSEVIVVDDVITDGATKVEAFDLIRSFGATPVALVIAFDRREYADDRSCSSVESFARNTGVPVFSIADVDDLLEVLREDSMPKEAAWIEGYLRQYGARSA